MHDLSPSADGDELTRAWRRHHSYVVNLAYQMLGDVGAAEDVAQEAFLRLAAVDPCGIEDVRGWLTVVAGRLCLDHVRSARARRERPADLSPYEASVPVNQKPPADPADRVTLDDEVREALLLVLRMLSPGERVAFVLHDVFRVPFETIAETVGRPAATCRQLARRARTKIAAVTPALGEVTDTEYQRVAETFISACANGDIQALISVLDPAAWGVGTLLGDPMPPLQVNHGPVAVATNLLRFLGSDVTLVSGPAGQPVLLGFARHKLFAVIVLTLRKRRILKIEATVDVAARLGANAVSSTAPTGPPSDGATSARPPAGTVRPPGPRN